MEGSNVPTFRTVELIPLVAMSIHASPYWKIINVSPYPFGWERSHARHVERRLTVGGQYCSHSWKMLDETEKTSIDGGYFQFCQVVRTVRVI